MAAGQSLMPTSGSDMAIRAIQDSQARLQDSFMEFIKEFGEFNGRVTAELRALNEKFEKQNGRVTENEKRTLRIVEGLQGMGATVDGPGDFQIRRQEKGEPSAIIRGIHALSGIPPRIWWGSLGLVTMALLIIALQGGLAKFADQYAERTYQLQHPEMKEPKAK